MSDASSFDFSKFVPGFDFLKKLSSTGSTAGLPSASTWIAPTLDPEELDKRIQELKTVHFWLDQNTKAVSATIQALEVQKMTLATLRGMNMSMSDLAESLKIKPDSLSSVFTPSEGSPSSATSDGAPQTQHPAAAAPRPASQPKARPAKKPRATRPSAQADTRSDATSASAGGVDPMAWWGSLTQQFQQIANQAVQDLQRHQPPASGDDASPKASAATRSAKGSSKASSSKSKPARKSGRTAPRRTDT
jgi:hypothetical protein